MMHRRPEQSRLEANRADSHVQRMEIEGGKKMKFQPCMGLETFQSHGEIKNVCQPNLRSFQTSKSAIRQLTSSGIEPTYQRRNH
jgi:hypothetical protein